MPHEVRLQRISIRNYRSCIRTQLSPHPNLSCLIGHNSSGKTSILHAIRLLKSIFAHSRGVFEEEGPLGTCGLKAEFRYGGRQVVLRLEIYYSSSETGTDDVIDHRASWNFNGAKGKDQWLSIPVAWLFDRPLFGDELIPHRPSEALDRLRLMTGQEISRAMFNAILAVCDYIRRITYYGASQFTNPSRCPTSFQVEEEKRIRTPMRSGFHSKFISDLYFSYVRRNESTDYAQFMDLVGPKGLHLVNRIQFPSYTLPERRLKIATGGRVTWQTLRRKLVVPNVLLDGTRLSPNQLSEGTFKTLALIFYLVSDRSRLLLLEEPEVCVHHGLLNSIVELIKQYSNEKQIIFSTHSDFVLDAVAPENVFFVSRTSKRGTVVNSVTKALSARDFSVLRKYLAETGNLGEFWRHGGFASVD